MKTLSKDIFWLVVIIGLSCVVHAQPVTIDTSSLELVPRDELPRFGTFWIERATGLTAPLPCPPGDMPDAPTYALPNGQFLVDATAVQPATMTASSTSVPFPGGGGGGGGTNPPAPPNIPNYAKFMAQVFSVLDTNYVANTDTNLYNVIISFPAQTNTAPTLQIARYGADAVVIKATHFDYSAETRDFALIICDKVETPVWRTVDLSATNAADGWLIQGAVPPSQVTDPMYLLVSNLNLLYNGFFRAIPYGGPQLVLSGAQPYDTVSNMLSLRAVITDLSGANGTNQALVVTVNGLQTRASVSLGATNTIALDTRYTASGYEDVEVSYGNVPVVFDPQNPPMDTQLGYGSTATLYLDFENPAFLVNASDMCSPDMGTNLILFGVNQADHIQVTISAPTDGRILASYGGNVLSAETIVIPWNFTEANGTTPYTNDAYAVHFVANDPTTLDVTNTIDRYGVRSGAGVIMTYCEESDTNDQFMTWINSQAETWIAETLAFLYNDIYDQFGLTQYYPHQIGYGRNITADYDLNPGSQGGWKPFLQQKLGSLLYSDLTWGPTHGAWTGAGAKGPGYSGAVASSSELGAWAQAAGQNWRMRKVAMWACNTVSTNPAVYVRKPPFPFALGIRPKPLQDTTFMRKNSGLFFAASFPEQGFGSPLTSIANAEEGFDQFWVTGPNSYPGGCEPNWAIARMLRYTLGSFPGLSAYQPVLAGYYWLPYTTLLDDQIMGNNLGNVNQ